MADFRKALPALLDHEGVKLDERGVPIPGQTGYANRADDSGGETNFGITIKTARANGYTGPMLDMPFEIAVTIYKREYWDIHMLDEIPEDIAMEVFDSGVNCGSGNAARWLQRTLNILNLRGTLYADVPVTGRIDGATIAALKSCLAAFPDNNKTILRFMDSLQGAYYLAITEANPKNESNARGWALKRLRG